MERKKPVDPILGFNQVEMKIPVDEPEIISREEWGALPFTSSEPVVHPCNYLRNQVTGTGPCNSMEECIKMIQDLQRDHMENHGLPDIQFSFILTPDGNIYEGRGWNRDPFRPGKHDTPLKGEMINLGFMCDHEKMDNLPKKLERSAVTLITWAQQQKMIIDDLIIYSHKYGNVDFTPF